MKRLVLIGLTTIVLTAPVFGQGAFILDTTQCRYGIASHSLGNYYSGKAGLQVWYLNDPTGSHVAELNSVSLSSGIGGAYSLLSTYGFTLATTFTGVDIIGGDFYPRELILDGVNPGTITLSLVVWSGTGSSPWLTDMAGMLTFTQPVVDPYPPGLPPDLPFTLSASTGGFNERDLLIGGPGDFPPKVSPEPSSFAIFATGLFALLASRRKGHRRAERLG